ncbi:MAG: excinuclease ABC subunit UvrB [Anaerolineales bacterium]|nr:excinuclease ABC subunit UvrB [Anaerolineales bacterium]
MPAGPAKRSLMRQFNLQSEYQPMGDQPEAITKLVAGVNDGARFQTLLGATGTGKTFTMANVIQQTQRPTLVIAHNKTLAAQLYSEFREFFPDNAVSYFVSYYDYYQPEAYVPRHDLYIEKETQINDEIDRLRLQATANLMSRRDVIIVASVSCIYGIGNPQLWGQVSVKLARGQTYRRDIVLRHLVDIQYERNDLELRRGTFRVRGDTLQIYPAYAETAFVVEFWGDDVERIAEFDPLTGEVILEHASVEVFPARQFITDEEKLGEAINKIETELTDQIAYFKQKNMLLEAQRIEQRTMYDLEMLKEVGYTSGIENYSRHLDGRSAGEPPWTLLDYFPADFLLVVDESHMTIPQVRGMYAGDRSRKQTLVDYGFRLPSAIDNRPLNFDEFVTRINQVVFTSATPGPYELEHSQHVVEQVIRPTGILDPQVEVRQVMGQVDDLLGEINRRVGIGQRVLVTTLTKRMAEDLSDYLLEMGVRVHYLHSEIHTLERTEILRDLRMGVYDVVVGINLLREGLDLPEVSLVAILDADKEGFLRSGTALVQTIGRAARHVEGKVIMYADTITPSMQFALEETERRRQKQQAYNEVHGIEPKSIMKAVRDLTDEIAEQHAEEAELALAEKRTRYTTMAELPKDELTRMIKDLEKQMKHAAQQLEFEKAAALRDQIVELRRIMVLKEAGGGDDMPAWEKMRLLDEAGIGYD